MKKVKCLKTTLCVAVCYATIGTFAAVCISVQMAVALPNITLSDITVTLGCVAGLLAFVNCLNRK